MKEQMHIKVDPKKVVVRDNFNPRVKPFTDDLKPSILEHGIRDEVEAVEQVDGTYLLNAQGHRRLLALQELIEEGHKKTNTGEPLLFPVKLVEATDDLNSLRLDIITLNTGKPLEMIEEARVLGALVAGIEDKAQVREKAKEIADKIGKSVNAVMNLIALLDSSKVTQKLIESGKASASLAIELFLAGKAKGDWAKVEEALVEAVAEAAKEGKTKATKKNTKADREEESEEDEAAAEEERQAKADVKARTKELIAQEKRAGRFSDFATALTRDEAIGVEKALIDFVQISAQWLYPQADLIEGEIAFGDINANYKAALRTHFAAVKTAVDEQKEVAKAEIAELKKNLAEKIAEIKLKAEQKVEAVQEKLETTKAKVAELKQK